MITNKQKMTDTNRYNRGKIYAIRSHQTDMVYIGSTCQRLSQRLSEHRRHYKYWKNGKRNNVTSFEIIKYPDCYIELVEDYKCESKMELDRKEGEIIRETENCVNKRVAGRTNKQYYEDNKEEILEYKKQHYENNKEELKQYYQDNKEKIEKRMGKKYTCECGSEIRTDSKARHEKTKKHKDFTTSYRSSM